MAEALSAERPYRAALPVDEVLAIMRRDAGERLDADAFAALEAWLPGPRQRPGRRGLIATAAATPRRAPARRRPSAPGARG